MEHTSDNLDIRKWRPDKSKFKHSSKYNRGWVTWGMFIDPPKGTFVRERDMLKNLEFAQYTYGDDHLYKDGKFYPSLKKIFLDIGDPTGYEFYTKYLGGQDHWDLLFDQPRWVELVNSWQEELEVRLRSAAIREIAKLAVKGQYAAAKYIAEAGWKTNLKFNPNVNGRMTKRERLRNERLNNAVEARALEGEEADIVRLLDGN